MAYAHITTISHKSSTERQRFQSTMSVRTLHTARHPATYSQSAEKWTGSSEMRGNNASPAVARKVAAHTTAPVAATLERMAAPAEPCRNRLEGSASFNR